MKIKNITNSFQNTKPIFSSCVACSTHSPPPYCSTVHTLTATRAQVWIWSPQYCSTVHLLTTTCAQVWIRSPRYCSTVHALTTTHA